MLEPQKKLMRVVQVMALPVVCKGLHLQSSEFLVTTPL